MPLRLNQAQEAALLPADMWLECCREACTRTPPTLPFCSRGLYTSCRPLFTVAVRLGMVSLPAITLSAAYRADVAPNAGTPLPLLAWRILLASRACVLLVPAVSRRTGVIPQAGGDAGRGSQRCCVVWTVAAAAIPRVAIAAAAMPQHQ